MGLSYKFGRVMKQMNKLFINKRKSVFLYNESKGKINSLCKIKKYNPLGLSTSMIYPDCERRQISKRLKSQFRASYFLMQK